MEPKDYLDLLLVAAVLYAVLVWLRVSLPRGVARRSMVAAPIAASTYALAQLLDLYLLEQVLEVLLIVVLVGAVVVYQTDIRRLLDRAFTGRTVDPPPSQLIDTLTEAAAYMAANKIGALIAIRGREQWPSAVQGGIPVGGVVSAPLLYSIFDPSTPGHDGAVLIEEERLARFAAHLPLADDVPGMPRYAGTRHAAALGLSQQCDAFVIVVSEERGTIGAAHEGTLTAEITSAALADTLREFLRGRASDQMAALTRGWSSARARTALTALALAAFLWLMFAHSPDTVLRAFSVPLALENLPEDWAIVGDVPAEVHVELHGSERSFNELDAGSLSVSIDVSRPSRDVREFVITDDNLPLPSGIYLRRVLPTSLFIEMQPTRTVRVPVAVATTGVLPSDLELVGVQPEPDVVSLVVPEHAVQPDVVRTEPVDLRRIDGDTARRTPFAVPADSHLPSGASSDVMVKIDVRRRQ
jgi:diadenylate cyclase